MNQKIEGLDWEAGCKSVNNDEELFLDVLRSYSEEGQEILDRYADFHGEDLERTVIDMHGMKSASAGIGAMEISEKFKGMELEGKIGNAEYLLENMSDCMACLKQLIEAIDAYLAENEKAEVNLDGQPEEQFPAGKLEEMIGALEDIEFEAFEEQIAELRTRNFGSVINEGLAKAQKAYDNFDYDDAKEALEALKGLG